MATNLHYPDGVTITGTSVIISTADAPSAMTEPTLTTQLTLSTTAATFVQAIGAANGAVGTPSLTFASDLDTGLYRIGANQMGAAVGGALVSTHKSVGVNVVGNVEHGAVSAFGTTEPVSASTYKTGTAPSGAVTTSGGVFTDGSTMKKIIAAGTVSDIQT